MESGHEKQDKKEISTKIEEEKNKREYLGHLVFWRGLGVYIKDLGEIEEMDTII